MNAQVGFVMSERNPGRGEFHWDNREQPGGRRTMARRFFCDRCCAVISVTPEVNGVLAVRWPGCRRGPPRAQEPRS